MRIALYLVAVAAAVAGAVWLANDPGAAILTWRGWQVQTSVALLLILALVLVLALWTLLRVAAWVRGSLKAYAAQQRERRMRRGLATLGDGFAAAHAGHGATARRLAREAGALLGETPAVLVLRKQAAALDGDAAELKAAAEALLERPETEAAALKALATRALADGDAVGATSYARRALTRGEAHDWAVRLLLDAAIAGARWGEALEVLDGAAARTSFAPAERQKLRARLRVEQARAQLAEGQPAAAARTAERAMDEGGGVAAVALYAKAMAAQGKGRKAASDIERAWARRPDPLLLAAYRALVPGETALDWARRVETLTQSQPDHPESRLAIAEASLGAELWGRARQRLNGLTSELQPPSVRARAARLMADLENGERGDTAAVARWLREALKAGASAEAPPSPPSSAAALLAEA
jgi:HemY protein